MATAPVTAVRKSSNGARARAARADAAIAGQSLEAQIARLQADLKDIAATLGRIGNDKVTEARSTAKQEYRHALSAGQSVIDDVTDQAGALEKQLKDTIREKPLTAVAAAIGIGFVIALLTR